MSKCKSCMREVHEGFNFCPTCGGWNVTFYPDDFVRFEAHDGGETDDELTNGKEVFEWWAFAVRSEGALSTFDDDGHVNGWKTEDGRSYEFAPAD